MLALACLFHTPLLGNAFVYAIQESHLPGLIVCAVLLLLSTLSWAVMITKFVTLGRARRNTARFIETFHTSHAPLDVYADGISFDNAPVYWVYRAGCKEAAYQLTGSSEVDEALKARLQSAGKISPAQMDSVTTTMEHAVGEVSIRLENQMTFLATAVSGAPFLGLLGTVWGVMETFSGVASAGTAASLQDMAPGVSAALVTTVIALLVAIPAMFGYNFLINGIKTLIARMDNFVVEMSSSLERRYIDHGATAPPVIAAAKPQTMAAALASSATLREETASAPAKEKSPADSSTKSEPDGDHDDAPADSSTDEPPPGFYSPPQAPPEPEQAGKEETKPKSETATQPDPELEPKAEPEPQLSPVPEPEQEPESKPKPHLDPDPAPELDPDPTPPSPPKLKPHASFTPSSTPGEPGPPAASEETLPPPSLSDLAPKASPETTNKPLPSQAPPPPPKPAQKGDLLDEIRSKPGESPLEDLLFEDDDKPDAP